MSIDSEREMCLAAIKRAGDAIAIATRIVVLAQKMIQDCDLTSTETEATDEAYDWAYERGLFPWQQP